MATRALVTGVTGQDGAYLVKLLLDKGYQVYGTYLRTSTPNFWRLDARGVTERITRLHAAASPLYPPLRLQCVNAHAALPGNDRADFIARRRLLSELKPDRRAFQAAVRGFSRPRDFAPGPYLNGARGWHASVSRTAERTRPSLSCTTGTPTQ